MPKVNDETHEASPPDFRRHPSREIACQHRACEVYRTPTPGSIEFWDAPQPSAGLRCSRCQQTWADPTVLYRLKSPWNTPYYGLLIAAASAVALWVLPASLMPWSATTKGIFTVLCVVSVFHTLGQLLRRQRRLGAYVLLGQLGQPAHEAQNAETSRHLQEQLSGKSSSIDGELKRGLLQLVVAFQNRAAPLLPGLRYDLDKALPLEPLRSHPGHRSLADDERPWVEARLRRLEQLHQNRDAWKRDLTQATDLLDSITADLETLRYGDPQEKADAKDALQNTLKEGRALLERIEALT